MAILEDEQRLVILGVVAGVVATGVVKYLGPAFSGTGRPLLKGLIRTGLLTYEGSREKFAQASEVIEDLIAEVRAELDAESQTTTRQQADPATQTNGEQ